MTGFLFDIGPENTELEKEALTADETSIDSLPANWPANSDWTLKLQTEMQSPAFQQLMHFVEKERREQVVYPAENNVFRAFELTSYADTRVVILGQDPYHGADQAHGLSFSVPPALRKLPPSLKNIFKELYADFDQPVPDLKTTSGNLEHWARQGVLLLNTVLTVRESQAASHQKKGWEQFTDAVIGSLNDHPQPIVFILWGKHAENKKQLIQNDRHHTIISAHPSPLSASRGFLGSRPFSKSNAMLESFGRKPVNWIAS